MTTDNTWAEADKIMRMIEEVDPADTAKLDEIDALFWCWLPDWKLIEYRGKSSFLYETKNEWRNVSYSPVPIYTRSRDALKAVRPKGYRYLCLVQPDGKFYASISKDRMFDAGNMPTEELAELCAIIKAIKWERENGI